MDWKRGVGSYTIRIGGDWVGGPAPRLERKRAASHGSATVLVATLGVVDRDGDIVLPGALANREAIVSRFNHAAVRGADPVGSARLEERGERLLGHVQYDDGDACRAVAAAKPDWSVGYVVLQRRDPTPSERAQGAKRVIQRWQIDEVSPVDQGAGIGTGTLACSCKGVCGCGSGPASRPMSEADYTKLLDDVKATSLRVNAALAELGVEWVEAWVATPTKRAPWPHFAQFVLGYLGRRGAMRVKWYTARPGSPLGFFSPAEPDAVALRADLDGAELLNALAHELLHAEARGKGFRRSHAEINAEAAWLVAAYLGAA